MREFDRVLSDLERSPRRELLAAPVRDAVSRLPKAQRDRVLGVLDADTPLGSLRGGGKFDALIVRDQMAVVRAVERWARAQATSAGELRAGSPPEILLEWGRTHGVHELLDLPVRLVVDPRGAWVYADRRVLDVLAEPPAVSGRETVLQRVQASLCDRLRAGAAAVAKGRAEEVDLPAEAPQDPRLSSLWLALTAVRAGLRTEVEPSGGLDAEPRLEAAKGGVSVSTWRTCPRSGGLATQVNLGLRGAPALSCGCARRDGRCGLGLALVDRTLRGLHGPLGATVADWLAEPVWVDRLRRLDVALDRRGNSNTIGWRIDFLREVDVRPVVVTPRGLVPHVRGPEELADPVDRELFVLTSRNEGDAMFAALRRLVGHPRVFLDGSPADVAVGTLALRLVPTMFGARLVVLVDGQPSTAGALDGGVRVGSYGLAVRRGARVVLYTAGQGLRAVLADLRDSGDAFRAEALPGLMERWPSLCAVAPAEVDAALVGGAEDVLPDVVILLSTAGPALQVDVRVRVGAATYGPGEGAQRAWKVVEGRLVEARRDLHAETALAERWCERLHLPGPRVTVSDADEAWSLLDRLRTEGPPVVWTGRPRRALPAPRTDDLRLTVGSLDRWLTIEGGVDFAGQVVPLSELVAALRADRGTVLVGDDLVRLQGPVADRLRALAALSDAPGDALRVPDAAASLVAELGAVDGDAVFRDLIARWRAVTSSEPALPAGLHAELREYQLEGYRFLVRLAAASSGALLCDDMGLGKTVQALAVLVQRASQGPQLVVAPTSVMANWAREAARFAPHDGGGLRVIVHHGSARDVGSPGPGDLFVTSWDLLVRDEKALSAVPFATVVFDEAQAVKNATTRRARAARAVQAGFRVVLTGTPLENRLSELWSLVDLAIPGLLGDARAFRDRFALPIEKHGSDDVRARLGQVLAPFLLRRTKAAVATELPARTEVIVPIDLDAAGRATYDKWRTSALSDLARRDLPAQNQRVLVLAALTALRQAACAGHLVDKALPRTSAKLERLREIVAELRDQGHQILVFSQFVSLLGIVREALAADGANVRYLDGGTPASVRQDEVDRFQNGDGDVFLISLKAGGTGLNLTAATYVVHLDPWWNPAVEDQASDRAHRIGQQRPVTVYKLVARGTVEEAIVALQGDKRALVEGVLGDTGKAAALPVEELVALLSYGATSPG